MARSFCSLGGRGIVEVEEVKKTRKEVQEDLEMQMW